MAGKKKSPPDNWAKGLIRNPQGVNGFSSGLQPFHKRAEHYLDKYPASEIIAIAADPKRLDQHTSWDAIVLKRLAASLDGRRDERDEVNFLVDRKEGKAVVRQEVRVIKGIGDLTEAELQAILASVEPAR